MKRPRSGPIQNSIEIRSAIVEAIMLNLKLANFTLICSKNKEYFAIWLQAEITENSSRWTWSKSLLQRVCMVFVFLFFVFFFFFFWGGGVGEVFSEVLLSGEFLSFSIYDIFVSPYFLSPSSPPPLLLSPQILLPSLSIFPPPCIYMYFTVPSFYHTHHIFSLSIFCYMSPVQI